MVPEKRERDRETERETIQFFVHLQFVHHTTKGRHIWMNNVIVKMTPAWVNHPCFFLHGVLLVAPICVCFYVVLPVHVSEFCFAGVKSGHLYFIVFPDTRVVSFSAEMFRLLFLALWCLCAVVNSCPPGVTFHSSIPCWNVLNLSPKGIIQQTRDVSCYTEAHTAFRDFHFQILHIFMPCCVSSLKASEAKRQRSDADKFMLGRSGTDAT